MFLQDNVNIYSDWMKTPDMFNRAKHQVSFFYIMHTHKYYITYIYTAEIEMDKIVRLL